MIHFRFARLISGSLAIGLVALFGLSVLFPRQSLHVLRVPQRSGTCGQDYTASLLARLSVFSGVPLSLIFPKRAVPSRVLSVKTCLPLVANKWNRAWGGKGEGDQRLK